MLSEMARIAERWNWCDTDLPPDIGRAQRRAGWATARIAVSLFMAMVVGIRMHELETLRHRDEWGDPRL